MIHLLCACVTVFVCVCVSWVVKAGAHQIQPGYLCQLLVGGEPEGVLHRCGVLLRVSALCGRRQSKEHQGSCVSNYNTEVRNQ